MVPASLDCGLLKYASTAATTTFRWVSSNDMEIQIKNQIKSTLKRKRKNFTLKRKRKRN
jgi:hypothetical protein